MQQNRILRITETSKGTSLSKATIYRGVKAGTFPRPVRLSERRVGWLESDIADFLSKGGAKC